MNIKLITVTSHPEYATDLIKSAKNNNWDLVVVQHDWFGFGTKLIGVRQYLEANPQVDRFIFCDSFDVLVFGTPEEFLMKFQANGFNPDGMVASAERGLWPPTLEIFREQYPKHEHGFNFINSGLYYANRAKFIEIYESCVPEYATDDQEWLNSRWLAGCDIEIDHNQSLFNSHSHISPTDYTYDRGRIQILGNESVFVHKNGRTVDEKLDKLVA